ncbi:uncharacterized protein LOC106880611 [Octopus bimaculoides]|nr:uncharacterized protein LOC106880611 [Octopus bimaculoides]|eukprot:XP_014786111.1 PREDICTED: uncharacterized protein LOC106880611 [Octopus bimaculoides]
MYIYLRISLHIFLVYIIMIKTSTLRVCRICQQNSTCYPPKCVCCKDSLPTNGENIKDFPQIVYFTFDDAVTLQTTKMYKKLFSAERKNPNGCRIKFTLFVSHNYTDYHLVNEFYKQGMEIASHSVNHRSDINLVQVRKEILGQKDNLVRFGNVPKEEIIGWRSPFLKPFGDKQVEILKEGGYIYDATLTYSKRHRKAIYPFTLDYGWPFRCQIPNCPEMQHPGFWEVPVVSVTDKNTLYDCVYTDGCTFPPTTYEEAYRYLWNNFLDYYNGNRAPMGVHMHAAWFFYNYPDDPYRLKAMDRFIRELLKKPDVHIITIKQMLEWVKNPVKNSEINSLKSWQCDSSNDFIKNFLQQYKYNDIHKNESLLQNQFKPYLKEKYTAKENRLYNISILEDSDNIASGSNSDNLWMSQNKLTDYKERRAKEEIKSLNTGAESRKKPMPVTEHVKTKTREWVARNFNLTDGWNQNDQSQFSSYIKESVHKEHLKQMNTKVSQQNGKENKKKKIYNQKQLTKNVDHSRIFSGSYFPRYHINQPKDFREKLDVYKNGTVVSMDKSEIFFKTPQNKTLTRHLQGRTSQNILMRYTNTKRNRLNILTVNQSSSLGSLMTSRSINNNSSGNNNIDINSPYIRRNTSFALDKQVLKALHQADDVWKTSVIANETSQPFKSNFQARAGVGNQEFSSRYSKRISIKSKNVKNNTFKTCQQGKNCLLPYCRCMNANVGIAKMDDIPQFVYFTFNGPITNQFFYSMISLFNLSHLNLRCPIKATYFVSDEGTSYDLVRKLYEADMDIALQGNSTSFYSNKSMLALDIQSQKFKMTHGAGIPAINITGWRSPSMFPLGDDQMKILQKEHFIYDSTLIYKQGCYRWPFTLDFGWGRTCPIGKCPTGNFYGFWEVPVIPLLDKYNYTCVYADGCLFNPTTAKDTLDFLLKNLAVHYQEKIPYGVQLRHDWFNPSQRHNLEGLKNFISKLVNMSDVYIVSIAELIQWIKQPKTLQLMKEKTC